MTDENKVITGILETCDDTNKGGRPTKYKDHYVVEVEDLMDQGYTDARMCAHWGIGRTTFYNWLNDNKEFKAAHNRGLEKAEAWWEEFGLAGMTGKIPKFNSTMWIAFMNNKFKWSRKDGDEKTTNINIGSMQVLQNLQQLSDTELDSKISGLLSNLQLGSKEDIQHGTNNKQGSQEGTSTTTSGEGE